MAPRIIPAQRRLGVKTVPDNQRIIKPQCDTMESDNKLHLVMLTLAHDNHILQVRASHLYPRIIRRRKKLALQIN